MNTVRHKLYLLILIIVVFLGLAGGATSIAQAGQNQANEREIALFEPVLPANAYPEVPGDFNFYAIYDRLTDTDTDNILISPGGVGMSGDGKKLIYAGTLTENSETKPVLYTMNVDGTNKRKIQLPPEVTGIQGVAINYYGSFAFFNNKNGEAIYKVEGQTVTKIIDASTYSAIDRCNDIKITDDGAYVYFLTYSDYDIWKVSSSGGSPEKIVEDTLVPRGEGKTGYQISYYDISGDGSVVAFIQPAVKPYQPLSQVFVWDVGGFRQLTQDTGGLKQYLALSSDGNTIVFKHGVEYKWYSINVLSEVMTEIADASIYSDQPVLTKDGDVMFEYITNLVYTDGSGGLDLFPRYDVTSIPISATYGRNISDDGNRVAFLYQYASYPFKRALYVGYLNAPDAVSSAPVIHWSSFNPPAMPRGVPDARITLSSWVTDPAGLDDIEKTRMYTYLDGRYTNPYNCPVDVKAVTRDDGVSPDTQAGDGVFTTWGEPGTTINELNEMTVRMSVMDASKTIVVADKTLLIFNPQHLVGPSGDTITIDEGNIEVEIPSGAVPNETIFILIPLTTPTENTGYFTFAGTSFQLSAIESGTSNPITTFDPPLVIKTYYDNAALGDIDPEDQRLYYWNTDTSTWRDALCPGGEYIFNLEETWFSVPVCHLSEFAVLDSSDSGFEIFLPILLR